MRLHGSARVWPGFLLRGCLTRQTACWVVFLLTACAALTCAACGKHARKATFPVSGKMFWKNSSFPAAGAHVVFHPLDDSSPENWPAGYPHGKVAVDGSFSLSTYSDDDGAPAGRYAVLVTWVRQKQGAGEEEEEEDGPDVLDGAYADPNSPPFQVEVKSTGNDPSSYSFVLR